MIIFLFWFCFYIKTAVILGVICCLLTKMVAPDILFAAVTFTFTVFWYLHKSQLTRWKWPCLPTWFDTMVHAGYISVFWFHYMLRPCLSSLIKHKHFLIVCTGFLPCEYNLSCTCIYAWARTVEQSWWWWPGSARSLVIARQVCSDIPDEASPSSPRVSCMMHCCILVPSPGHLH